MLKQSRQSGYSLVELMIVIAVIAVITSVAVPWYKDYAITLKCSEAINNIATLEIALREYHIDNNAYVSGEYSAGSTTTLQDSLGWKPGEADAQTQFRYQVSAGDCGDLNRCYLITATGLDKEVPSSTTVTKPSDGKILIDI